MRAGSPDAVTGSELPAYRALSLVCAALIVWLTFLLVARSSPVNAALVASLLVTTSVPFWATATSGRFYAPFLAAFLAVQLALSTLRTTCTLRTLCTIAAAQRLDALDPRAGVHSAPRSPRSSGSRRRDDRRRWLLGTHCGWSRSGGRPGRDFRAALLRAEQRRNDGAAVLPVAGVEPVRAARRSPVHDPARRDGDCVDRGSGPGAAGVGDCVVVVGDDPDLLGGARDQQRAAVA